MVPMVASFSPAADDEPLKMVEIIIRGMVLKTAVFLCVLDERVCVFVPEEARTHTRVELQVISAAATPDLKIILEDISGAAGSEPAESSDPEDRLHLMGTDLSSQPPLKNLCF